MIKLAAREPNVLAEQDVRRLVGATDGNRSSSVIRAVVGAVSAAAFMLAPAVADAQTVHIVNAAHLSPRAIARFEAAAGRVANGSLRAAWGSPGVRWTRAGGSMTLVLVNHLGPVASSCGQGAAGCHGVVPSGAPVAVVDTSQADTGELWTVSASHELFEMLVDPLAQTTTPATGGSGEAWIEEVADPVEDYAHRVRGVSLSDFVYPAWFLNVTGRQDAMGRLNDFDAGTGQYEFSCPTGYAQYWDPSLGAQMMGPAFDGTCDSSIQSGTPQGARLRMGRGARRDRMFVIGRPLKIRRWWDPPGSPSFPRTAVG